MITQILWTSIASAGFQVLLTCAFALVVRVTGIWNFSQPALMGVAFYVGYVARQWLGWALLPAFVLAAAATMALAILIETQAFRRLRARRTEPLFFFIFTLVFSQFFVFLLTLLFTSEPVFLNPTMGSQMLLVAPVIISTWDLTSVAAAVVGVAALALFLRSRLGQHVVAVADNPALAEVFGIHKNTIYVVVMGVAGLLIALATFVYGGKLAFYPDLGPQLMIFAVAATILAGLGQIFGAALAAVLISVLQQMSVFYLSSNWQPLIVYGVLFVAIIVFPRGIHLPGPRLRRMATEPVVPAKLKVGA